MTKLSPNKRLIVALDPKFTPGTSRQAMIDECKRKLEFGCEHIGPLGAIGKVNTLFRVLGWQAIEEMEQAGLSVFLDGKFFDIKNTVLNDLAFWSTFGETIEICTLAYRINETTFFDANSLMPDTTFSPVDPLTDLDNPDFIKWYGHDRQQAVTAFLAAAANLEGADGIICSARDIKFGPNGLSELRQLITPGIRRTSDPADDNSINSMAPHEAIRAGAARLVVGRPITSATDPASAAVEIIEEITNAL